MQEVAWRQGWITAEQLNQLAQPEESGYGFYLLQMLEESVSDHAALQTSLEVNHATETTAGAGTPLQGPLLITPQACDDRGWFYSWNQRKFDDAVGEAVQFSQDNPPVRSRVCFGVCTTSSHRNPRPSWCAPRLG